MKRIATILSFLAIALSFTSFITSEPSLIGKWKGEDNGQVGLITFDKEGYVTFTIGDETVGGKEYNAEGMIFDMYYETDETVTPHTMDFVIKLHDEQTEITRILGIYEFADKKTLHLNMRFEGGDRPTEMEPGSNNHILLKKVK